MSFDLDVTVSEADLRALARTSNGPIKLGTTEALNSAAGHLNFVGGEVPDLRGAFNTLNARIAEKGPWLANTGKHWIIVDGYDEARGVVRVRDPWNSDIPEDGFEPFEFGREAEVRFDDFMQAWENSGGGVVYRD